MSDQREQNPEPLTTSEVDASGQPLDPDQIDAPQPAPMDDAAGGPTATPEEEKVAAQLGDFA